MSTGIGWPLSEHQSRMRAGMSPGAEKAGASTSMKRTPDGASFSGPNLLGRLLMELRAGGGALAYTRPLPADIVSFRDLA